MTRDDTADDPGASGSSGMLDALLSPLRLPRRVVAEIEMIGGAVRSLADTAERRLSSIDDSAGTLVEEIAAMRAALTRIESKVDELTGLEQTIEERMEGLRKDLNTRMRAVERQVGEFQAPINHLALDVSRIQLLLPEPGDGPLARLKDTLTKS